MTASFPLACLAERLSPGAREHLRQALAQLLAWQRTLTAWPERITAPDATPIVSLYRAGALAGCAGLSEGSPAARLQRAFVTALADSRFGGVDAGGREELVAQVSYALAPRSVPVSGSVSALECGVHGLALVRPSAPLAMLLPDVARDHHLGPADFLEALAQKADTPRSRWPEDALWLFETETVIARAAPPHALPSDRRAAAIRWLSARVARSGQIVFGIEPRSGSESPRGPMWHGRAALALRALDAHPEGHAAAARLRRWLERDITDALAGKPISGWPEARPLQCGTVALAALAGLNLTPDLLQLSAEPELLQNPWHAAQVAAALGERAPAQLFSVCARDLASNPWAPWTALAAHRRGDSEILARTVPPLIDSLEHAKNGEASAPPIPELARTAATIEALRLIDDPAAGRAIARGRAFLLRHQLRAEHYPLSRDPECCDGAFPISPVHDYLQIDVTAHALLALSD